MNAININRGQEIRRALLAVARASHAQGVPLPKQARLSRVLGICAVQIWHHQRVLIASGALTVRYGRHKRLYVQEIRP